MKLNLGGGNDHWKGWTNVDYIFPARERKHHRENVDVIHNFMDLKPMPFEDNSVDAVYTEHCIEHLSYEAVEYLFKDVYRILKKGCPFRISCPDADRIYELYANKNIQVIGLSKRAIPHGKLYELIDAIATPICGLLEQGIVFRGDKDEILKSIDSLMSDSITMEEQFNHPGHHISWWNRTKLTEELLNIGFGLIHPMKSNCSDYEIFNVDYIDKTQPNLSIRIECEK